MKIVEVMKFQFPSNGKADPKQSTVRVLSQFLLFQFPSNGKADPKPGSEDPWIPPSPSCFNSLQTGKRIQSESNEWDYNNYGKFQFPSNGKADPKMVYRRNQFYESMGFNSLQTGKRIQSHKVIRKSDTWACVSIPFKRESGSKEY